MKKNNFILIILLWYMSIFARPISLSDAVVVSPAVYTTTAPSYDFNGTTDYIDLGADEPTDLTGDITISCWIRPEGWGEGDNGRILNNGKLELNIDDTLEDLKFTNIGVIGLSSANNSIVLNTWQHILVTRPSAGTNTNIYINGVLSGDANQDMGTPAGGDTNTFIGNRLSGTKTFDGQIKGLKIWPRLLSTTEITYEYNTSWRR